MSIVFDQYSERLRRKRKSPHTVRLFTDASRRLDDWLWRQGLTAETATVDDLEAYFDSLDLAPSSRNVHLRYIRAAYNYAAKRGTIRHNPALDVEEVEVDQPEPRVIPTSQLREIRERAWRDRDWVFFHLLAYTGMRRGEIVRLQWEDVRLDEQVLHVVGKGRKRRYVPIHPALGEVLVEEERVSPFVVKSSGRNGVAAQTVTEMTRRLHPTYTPHDYRRTVATSLARNGVRDELIDRIMGWAPTTVRDRFYRNVPTVELHQAILRLYADDPL